LISVPFLRSEQIILWNFSFWHCARAGAQFFVKIA
jgi:hypothetical protein